MTLRGPLEAVRAVVAAQDWEMRREDCCSQEGRFYPSMLCLFAAREVRVTEFSEPQNTERLQALAAAKELATKIHFGLSSGSIFDKQDGETAAGALLSEIARLLAQNTELRDALGSLVETGNAASQFPSAEDVRAFDEAMAAARAALDKWGKP